MSYPLGKTRCEVTRLKWKKCNIHYWFILTLKCQGGGGRCPIFFFFFLINFFFFFAISLEFSSLKTNSLISCGQCVALCCHILHFFLRDQLLCFHLYHQVLPWQNDGHKLWQMPVSWTSPWILGFRLASLPTAKTYSTPNFLCSCVFLSLARKVLVRFEVILDSLIDLGMSSSEMMRPWYQVCNLSLYQSILTLLSVQLRD